MNVILVLLDSLNKSYIEPYGNERVETKSMQRLAERGVVFENHFVGSAPCMPARRELFSGKKNEFLWKFWGAVEPFDRLLPIEAKRLGATAALVTDHYHYWEPMTGVYGYHENYSFTEFIRGHEMDNASTEPLEAPEDYPQWVKSSLKWRQPEELTVQYYRNVKHVKGEEDFHGPKVMRAACDWLDKNHEHENFFLHVESFDPHEPFYVPEPYRSMYGPYNEDFTCWPPYQDRGMFNKFMAEATEEELDFVRNQYCGKVTMVDRWLGRLWEKMDEYNLWDNTMVILTTDHGHALAEPEKKIRQYAKKHPMFEDVANIPLIIYHPRIEGGKRIDTTFSTIVDVRATILDALGAERDDEVMEDGKSLIPVLEGEQQSIRDYMLYGIFQAGAHITTRDATYIRDYDRSKPIYVYSSSFPLMISPSGVSSMAEYIGIKLDHEAVAKLLEDTYKRMESGFFIPGVKIPQWKIPMPAALFRRVKDERGGSAPVKKRAMRNYLFDRNKDPNFQNNLAGTPEGRELESKMIARLIEALKEEGCPPEQFARLNLEDEV